MPGSTHLKDLAQGFVNGGRLQAVNRLPAPKPWNSRKLADTSKARLLNKERSTVIVAGQYGGAVP